MLRIEYGYPVGREDRLRAPVRLAGRKSTSNYNKEGQPALLFYRQQVSIDRPYNKFYGGPTI